MSDLIDREELLYSLECVPIYELYEHYWKVEDVEKRINNMPSVKQWFPVSESLPMKGKWVLVTREWAGERYVEKDMRLQNSWLKDKMGGDNVVAWMPLPEPFEGGDAE